MIPCWDSGHSSSNGGEEGVKSRAPCSCWAPEFSPAAWARSRPGPQRSFLWGDGGGSPRCSPRTRRSRSSLQPTGATVPYCRKQKEKLVMTLLKRTENRREKREMSPTSGPGRSLLINCQRLLTAKPSWKRVQHLKSLSLTEIKIIWTNSACNKEQRCLKY